MVVARYTQTRLGIDFVTLDWTGICWGEATPVGKIWNGSFAERPAKVQRELNDSLALLMLHERMRAEGHQVPRIVPIMGKDNGPIASMACLNEALAWLGGVNTAHPGAFLRGRSGMSVVVIFDGSANTRAPDYQSHGFEVTMMSSQLQARPQLARAGFWSWMDGPGGPCTAGPAVTVTPAYFGQCPPHGPGMWLGPDAVGRRGGHTFYRQLTQALAAHPQIVLVSQWNEFAGQSNGGGYGEDKECFGDSYSRELSNDLEPTSLASTDCYVRPNSTCIGWGMYYVNLLQAILLGASETNETLLFFTSPAWMANVSLQRPLHVSWAIGHSGSGLPEALDFDIDGHLMATIAPQTHEGSVVLNLSSLAARSDGRAVLGVAAVGTGVASRFPLSLTQLDSAAGVPAPPRATLWLHLVQDR
jgi:hypothetical protein|eukprot:COSAG01_NODE_5170_length_4436_cov_159.454923_4_plen_416_part_00